MTLRDYGRFGQFILDGGKIGAASILPKGWVADASAPHVNFAGPDKPADAAGEFGYGYFWWIIPGGFAAEGVFGQQVFIYPKERLVIAVNSAWLKADDPRDWMAQGAFAEAVRKAVAHHG
jgi:CubicO group peptidase (beta-lactamase class C family)